MNSKKNLSDETKPIPKVGIICSEFNKDLVMKLYEGAREPLEQSVQILATEWVPGAGEIPQASRWLIEKHNLDALLACAVLIRGETAHFESLCRILENGLTDLHKSFSLPILFSVLMLENRNQADSRLGGNKGHRGQEAGQALIKMLALKQKLDHKG